MEGALYEGLLMWEWFAYSAVTKEPSDSMPVVVTLCLSFPCVWQMLMITLFPRAALRVTS